MIKNKADLIALINMAGQPDSLPVETSPNWREWVSAPCIKYPLAPREARAALEIIGFFAMYRVPVKSILFDIIDAHLQKRIVMNELE